MKNNVYVNEIFEAIDAADEALACLYEARNSLVSAKRWGVLDMMGGTIFSTMFKRNKMKTAQQHMNNAKQALKKFTDELNDIDEIVDLEFKMNDFLSFADYFFDNFFFDLSIQNRIKEARYKIDWTINAVQTIRKDLIEELNEVE